MTEETVDFYLSVYSGFDKTRRISVDQFDDKGTLFMGIHVNGGSANIALTKEDALVLLEAIQKIVEA